MRKVTTLFVSFVCLFVVAGCGGSYYQVKDPVSGSMYYTQKITQKKAGNIIFEDSKTGSKVTIQNSEVKKISKKEFKSALKDDQGVMKVDGGAPESNE